MLSFPSYLRRGLGDFVGALRDREFWLMLANREIKAQYRRTVLGPLWITVAVGAYVLALDVVYGRLFGLQSHDFMPWVAIGLVSWYFIATCINDSLNSFINYRGFILQHDKPMFTYPLVAHCRAALASAHHMIVVVLTLAVYSVPVFHEMVWIPLGLLLFVFSMSWIGMLLSVISLRYRDVPQIVVNVMQLAFFVTPVMYKPDRPEVANSLIIQLNPFAHMLAVVREPMLGRVPPMQSVAAVAAIGVVGWLVTLFVYGRFRNRVAYWL